MFVGIAARWIVGGIFRRASRQTSLGVIPFSTRTVYIQGDDINAIELIRYVFSHSLEI